VVITVAMRWTDRLIGLISTLILARLLAPEDFGIIAMASLVIGLADVLLDMGVHVSLIQNQQATQAHYNSAWTLKILQNSAVATVLLIGAPWAAAYFNNAQVTPVVQALAMAQLIAGFENIGVVQFQKEMQFQREFLFRFYRRLIGFAATMLAAWLLQSYWALVIGTLTMRSAGVVLSYLMHPMRPRLGTEKMREIFSVSQWMLVGNIGSFLENRLHRMFVGRYSSAAVMGGYTLADEISEMPTEEILSPVNRVLFPAFAKAAADLPELRRLFLLAQGLQNLVVIPAAVGLMMVASELVAVMLGKKWLFAVPFLQILALVNIGAALTSSSGYVLIVLKKIHLNVISNWISLASFAILAIVFLRGADAAAFAWLKLLTTVLFSILIQFWLLKRYLRGLGYGDLLRTFIRPLIAGGMMAWSLWFLGSHMNLPPFVALSIKIGAGALVYSAVAVLLWRLGGRPDGAEAYLIDKLRSRTKKAS
jgi:O-antigen/teichoic acid export membrane protein